MFVETIKEYISGKCARIRIRKKGFFSAAQDYEAKIFTTTPKETLPFEGDYTEIGEEIIENKANWIENVSNGYTHSILLSSYPSLKIQIKKID